MVQQVDRVVADALYKKPELLLAAVQNLLGSFALGQVAGDFCIPNHLARSTADRIDDDVGPKPRSVLADTPAFRLKFSFTLRGCQGARRQAKFSIFIGVKARKVLADNFMRRVALEPLRARIPRRHNSLGVQQKDCVIRHCLYQQAVTPLFGQRREVSVGSIHDAIGLGSPSFSDRKESVVKCPHTGKFNPRAPLEDSRLLALVGRGAGLRAADAVDCP